MINLYLDDNTHTHTHESYFVRLLIINMSLSGKKVENQFFINAFNKVFRSHTDLIERRRKYINIVNIWARKVSNAGDWTNPFYQDVDA